MRHASSDEPRLPSASVVIATRHRPDLLDRCLRALGDQGVLPSAVVVVDNSNGDEATRIVAGARRASYLVEPRRGVSRARNLGARQTTSDVVAYLDDDAVPDSDWLAALLKEFLDPQVAAVTGRILGIATPDTERHSPRASEQRVIFGGVTRQTFDRTTVDWFERANFGGVGQGANLAIRRSVFAWWAGFDERLGKGAAMAGAEEHHAFFCLIDRGYRVVYTPAATVHHASPATDAEARRLRLRQLQTTSAHFALLLTEEKRYRWRAAKYGLQAIAGRPATWRTEARAPLPGLAIARARVAGIASYLRMRLATMRDSEN
jgi:cellulose synthase/poly-beta-1,6-N-acetylglucosamine synthase-like glycosyltransferase